MSEKIKTVTIHFQSYANALIKYYAQTSRDELLQGIRETFNLPSGSTLLFKDDEGDIIILSPSAMPDAAKFYLHILEKTSSVQPEDDGVLSAECQKAIDDHSIDQPKESHSRELWLPIVSAYITESFQAQFVDVYDSDTFQDALVNSGYLIHLLGGPQTKLIKWQYHTDLAKICHFITREELLTEHIIKPLIDALRDEILDYGTRKIPPCILIALLRKYAEVRPPEEVCSLMLSSSKDRMVVDAYTLIIKSLSETFNQACEEYNHDVCELIMYGMLLADFKNTLTANLIDKHFAFNVLTILCSCPEDSKVFKRAENLLVDYMSRNTEGHLLFVEIGAEVIELLRGQYTTKRIFDISFKVVSNFLPKLKSMERNNRKKCGQIFKDLKWDKRYRYSSNDINKVSTLLEEYKWYLRSTV